MYSVYKVKFKNLSKDLEGCLSGKAFVLEAQDLSLIPVLKLKGRTLCSWNFSAGEAEQEDPWGSLTSQFSLIGKLQASKSLSQRRCLAFLRIILEVVIWLPCVHLHLDTHAHAHAHTHIFPPPSLNVQTRSFKLPGFERSGNNPNKCNYNKKRFQ